MQSPSCSAEEQMMQQIGATVAALTRYDSTALGPAKCMAQVPTV